MAQTGVEAPLYFQKPVWASGMTRVVCRKAIVSYSSIGHVKVELPQLSLYVKVENEEDHVSQLLSASSGVLAHNRQNLGTISSTVSNPTSSQSLSIGRISNIELDRRFAYTSDDYFGRIVVFFYASGCLPQHSAAVSGPH